MEKNENAQMSALNKNASQETEDAENNNFNKRI